MANTVRIVFKSYLPKPGFDTSGQTTQYKQEVRGEIQVSSYNAATGETLTPAQLDLFSIDYLKLEVKDPIKAPGKPPRHAAWNETNNLFYVFDHANDGTTPDAKVIEVAQGTAVTVCFNAFGPARTVPDLV